MLSIYDTDSAAAVLAQPLDPELRTLIEGRLADAAAIGLAELTHILVIQPGDTEVMILEVIGWSPLVDRLSEHRYGSDAFTPWEWVEDLGGWFEIVSPAGNAGFAYLLLIEQADGVIPELLQMCAEFCDDRR